MSEPLIASIEWTEEKLKEFKKLYEEHKGDGYWRPIEKEVFSFEEHEFYVGYAKYLIEYLERILKPN